MRPPWKAICGFQVAAVAIPDGLVTPVIRNADQKGLAAISNEMRDFSARARDPGGMKLKPDIVTLAKGVTSAYFPLSASVVGERIWKVLEQASPEYGPIMHGFTYSGHPVGGAIGLANLQIMEEEGMVENSARVGRYLLDQLRDAIGDHRYVGDLRGEGLMIAVEFSADRATRRPFAAGTNPHRVVSAKALELELMVRPLPFIEVIPFSPPLCMTEADCDEAVERFGRALDAVTPELDRLAAQTGA